MPACLPACLVDSHVSWQTWAGLQPWWLSLDGMPAPPVCLCQAMDDPVPLLRLFRVTPTASLALALTFPSHLSRSQPCPATLQLLFIQQAVKGTVEEFRQGAGTPLDPTWQLVNGLWSLFLAFALLLPALALRRARSWRFLKAGLRGLLADYGSVLVLVAISGLSFAVGGGGGSGGGGSVPRRVQSPNTWDVRSTWTVAGVRAGGGRGGRHMMVHATSVGLLLYTASR